MFRITEIISLTVVVGALVMMGMRILSFEQGIALISFGVGLISGKYFAVLDYVLNKRNAALVLMRKFMKQISYIYLGDDYVKIFIHPSYFDDRTVKKILGFAEKIFVGKTVKVEKGEEIRLV